MNDVTPPDREHARRHLGGLSETVDVYAGQTRLGSITKVREQWVPVCAHPDLAGGTVMPYRHWRAPALCCGQRLPGSVDPVVAKARLIGHHGEQHDTDEAA
jgi:hypothetical protein